MRPNLFFFICASAASLFAANVTVNPAETKQTVIGFGGGVVYYQNWFTALPDSKKEALYDTAFTGLNLSMLRLGNWLQEDGAAVSEHDIEIVKVDKYNKENKNYVIKITDDELLSQTGGIVQGMSGSPILQNGKLIGAITHVFLNDPTRGYGIDIQSMLNK
jgi:hypothetical protein